MANEKLDVFGCRKLTAGERHIKLGNVLMDYEQGRISEVRCQQTLWKLSAKCVSTCSEAELLYASWVPLLDLLGDEVRRIYAEAGGHSVLGAKIAAIKWYRQEVGCGLKDAKDEVERILE